MGRILLLIELKGGNDGLNTVIPYADDEYYRLRPTIAVPRPGGQDGAIALNDFFGLHPRMRALKASSCRM